MSREMRRQSHDGYAPWIVRSAYRRDPNPRRATTFALAALSFIAAVVAGITLAQIVRAWH